MFHAISARRIGIFPQQLANFGHQSFVVINVCLTRRGGAFQTLADFSRRRCTAAFACRLSKIERKSIDVNPPCMYFKWKKGTRLLAIGMSLEWYGRDTVPRRLPSV